MLEKIKDIKKIFCKDNFIKTKLVIAGILSIVLATLFEYKVYSLTFYYKIKYNV